MTPEEITARYLHGVWVLLKHELCENYDSLSQEGKVCYRIKARVLQAQLAKKQDPELSYSELYHSLYEIVSEYADKRKEAFGKGDSFQPDPYLKSILVIIGDKEDTFVKAFAKEYRKTMGKLHKVELRDVRKQEQERLAHYLETRGRILSYGSMIEELRSGQAKLKEWGID